MTDHPRGSGPRAAALHRARALGSSALKASLLKAAGSKTLQRQMTKNPLARRVAGRFIAGDALTGAVEVVRRLNASGASASLDYLGENTDSDSQARAATVAYLAALDSIRDERLDAEVSVKLTALGLDVRPALAIEEAARVAARAKETHTFVAIDMESHDYVDRTLASLDTLRRAYDNLGVCVQAYLYRTPDDLERLIDWQVRVRLVKGAYREPSEVAYPDKASVDRAFARLLERLMEAGAYPMIATHDPRLLRLTKKLAGRYQRDRDTFEFQMLYGVRRDLQQKILEEGYRVRVYVPYGGQWYPYFMRRLAEQPANLYFFLSHLAKA